MNDCGASVAFWKDRCYGQNDSSQNEVELSCDIHSLGSLSTRVFETRKATRSELFSLLTCLHTTTFTLLSIFSPLEVISIKIWETPLPWHAKCSLRVAVGVSKTRAVMLPLIH